MKKFSPERLRLLFKRSTYKNVFRRCNLFRSSIYGRVILIIAGSLLVLFVLFNIVSRTVYTDLFDVTITQTGDRVSSIVEGALYYSMLENDKTMLQRELDIISNMKGINEVNMYNEFNQLAYTSLSGELENPGDPNCTSCHNSFSEMFADTDKEYRIVD